MWTIVASVLDFRYRYKYNTYKNCAVELGCLASASLRNRPPAAPPALRRRRPESIVPRSSF